MRRTEKQNWKTHKPDRENLIRTEFCSFSSDSRRTQRSNRNRKQSISESIASGKENNNDLGVRNFSGGHSQGSRQGAASRRRRNPPADHDAGLVLRPRPRPPPQESLHHPRSQCFSSHRYHSLSKPLSCYYSLHFLT